MTALQGNADFVLFAAGLYVLAQSALSAAVEGVRRAKDRLAATLTTGALIVAVLPLAAVLGYAISQGHKRFDCPRRVRSARVLVGLAFLAREGAPAFVAVNVVRPRRVVRDVPPVGAPRGQLLSAGGWGDDRGKPRNARVLAPIGSGHRVSLARWVAALCALARWRTSAGTVNRWAISSFAARLVIGCPSGLRSW